MARRPNRRKGAEPSDDSDEFKLSDESSLTDVDLDAEFDVDELSPEEEVIPNTKKRVKKISPALSRTRRRPAKAKASAATGTSLLGPVTQSNQQSAFEDLRLDETKDTYYLTTWLQMRERIKVLEEVQPNKIEQRSLTPLRDLEDQPGRNFKAKVELVEIEVTWDPQEGENVQTGHVKQADISSTLAKYRKKINTWEVYIWNDDLPPQDRKFYRLFPELKRVPTSAARAWLKDKKSRAEPIDREKYFVRGAPLDESICPTKSRVDLVANEACLLVNKLPCTIDESHFPPESSTARGDKPPDSHIRELVELLSLRALGTDFDYRKIRYVFRQHKGMQPGQYTLAPAVSKKGSVKDGFGYQFRLPCFLTDDTRRATSKGQGIECASWPTIFINENAFTKENLDASPNVPGWFAIKPTEPLTTTTSNQEIGSIMKYVNYLIFETLGLVGSYDALMSVARELGKGRQHNSREGAKPRSGQGPFKGERLFRCSSGGTTATKVSLTENVLKTLSEPFGPIYAMILTTEAAMAMQSAYEVFDSGKGILKAIEELVVSIEEFRHHKSMRTIETYCRCETESQKKTMAHHCLYCTKMSVCSEMVKAKDGRLVCRSHLEEGELPSDNLMKSRISKLSSYCEKSLEERKEIQRVLSGSSWLPGLSGKYRDAYDGERGDYPPKHPLRMSLDAVFPVYKVGEDFHVHHAENVGLTTQFLNYLKGDDLPIILPAIAEAFRLSELKGTLPDDEIQRDLKKIAIIFDNCWRIRTSIPRSKENRVNAARSAPPEWWPRFERMMRSGVWDLSRPIFKMNYTILGSCANEGIWNKETIDRLTKIIKQMEADPTINPKKKRVPRGDDGAPWLWNDSHKFPNHDWNLLAGLFYERFKRMCDRCDKWNEHDLESPETLFLTCVILWFKLDGKDEILGLDLTIFQRHPLRFSIGRALNVEPGSHMRTGWTVMYPTSLSDYDDSLCTITMEAWVMNRGKADFPVTPEGIEEWKEAIRAIPTESPYWDTFSTANDNWRRVLMPFDWRRLNMSTVQIIDHYIDLMSDVAAKCSTFDRPYYRGMLEDLYSERTLARKAESYINDTSAIFVEDEEDDEYLPREDLEGNDVPPSSDGSELSDESDHEREPTGPSGKSKGKQKLVVEDPDESTVVQEWLDYYSSVAHLLPEGEQGRFNTGLRVLSKIYGAKINKTSTSSPEPAPALRIDLFHRAIGQLIIVYNHDSYMTLEELRDMALNDWRALEPDITEVFTEDEIIAFCFELDKRDDFELLQDEKALIYKPRQS